MKKSKKYLNGKEVKFINKFYSDSDGVKHTCMKRDLGDGRKHSVEFNNENVVKDNEKEADLKTSFKGVKSTKEFNKEWNKRFDTSLNPKTAPTKTASFLPWGEQKVKEESKEEQPKQASIWDYYNSYPSSFELNKESNDDMLENIGKNSVKETKPVKVEKKKLKTIKADPLFGPSETTSPKYKTGDMVKLIPEYDLVYGSNMGKVSKDFSNKYVTAEVLSVIQHGNTFGYTLEFKEKDYLTKKVVYYLEKDIKGLEEFNVEELNNVYKEELNKLKEQQNAINKKMELIRKEMSGH
jgi:hypothetical protein